MKQAKISELKNHLSRLLEHVRRGGTVRIFDRNRPIADIVPVQTPAADHPEDLEAMLSDLERRGIIRRTSGTLPEGFLSAKLPRARKSVVAALLEDRREGP